MDTVARVLAEKLRASLGQSVVVDNKPGASAMLGAQAVVKAAPDGHTLLLGTAGETAINPHVYKERMAYKPERDLTPISLVVRVPNVLVAQPGLPVKSVEELVAYAKKNPGKLSYPPRQVVPCRAHKPRHRHLLQWPRRGVCVTLCDLWSPVE